jgi:osmotically-inducible protein OsmY
MSRVLSLVAIGVFASAISMSAAEPLGHASSASPAVQSAPATSSLAAKVKARLDADAELKGHTITVTESKGAVTLEGEVPSVLARATAGEVAKTTEGVKKVNNKVKVKSESGGSL